MNSQLKKGILELCVLAMINDRDCYGYELVATISKHIEISEGTIYPLLRRLTEEKYVETYFVESNEGPSRKYYRITAKGRKAKKEQEEEWLAFSKGVNSILKNSGG